MSTPLFYRLIWLIPASFAAHVLEEWFGGFPGWVSGVAGGRMNGDDFIQNNAFFMAVLLMLAYFADYARSRWTAFLLLSWASANLFWDFLFHLVATIWWRVYSPGLIAATLLYLPVSWFVGRAALADGVLPKSEFAGAYALGAVLMGFVVWAGLYHFAT